MTIANKSSEKTFIEVKSDFFGVLYKELVKFFETKIPPVDSKQTITVMKVREAAAKALATPNEWINL